MRLKSYIIFIILIGWGIFLLLQQYILISPIFANLLLWIKRLFLLLLLWLVCSGTGECILARLKITSLNLPDRKLFEIGLGFSALSFLMFFLGILKLYYFFTGFILISILFLLLWHRIKNISIELVLSQPHLNFTLCRLISIGIGICLLIILTGSLIPPLDYDTLEYHLGVPSQYIRAHGIIYLPYNVYSNFPLHMEMLYTLGLLLDGPILPKMIHFSFLILTLLIVFRMGNRLHYGAGYLAGLIFATIPIVATTTARAYNDLGVAFWGLLSIYSVLEWIEKRDRKLLILASIFCGSSISTKYTGMIFFLIPLTFSILTASLRKKKILNIVSSPALFIGVSLLVAAPWLIKNIVYTHNPVFPIAYKIFGGRNWGDFEAARFKKHHQADLTDFKKIIEIPKNILSGQEGKIGIAVLLSLPFLFLIKNPPLQVKYLGLYSIYIFVVWIFFTHHMPRFLIPVLSLASVLSGYCMFYFLNLHKSLGYTMVAFLVPALCFNISELFYQLSLFHPMQFISGRTNQKEYISKILYIYPAIDFINTYLPQNSKVLFIAEARTFYCKKNFLANTPLDKNIIVEISSKSKSPEDILDRLKEMGVTHILYNVIEARRITHSYNSFNWPTPYAQENYLNFMEKYLKVIFSQEGVIVAELLYHS